MTGDRSHLFLPLETGLIPCSFLLNTVDEKARLPCGLQGRPPLGVGMV